MNADAEISQNHACSSQSKRRTQPTRGRKGLGVSVATLQNYESGKTVPQWGTVQKIEAVYNFPADFIFLS